MKKAAYIIPLAILLYILYQNYLPFGYDKTFVIEAGKAGDRDGQFYLDISQGLSERKTEPDGTPYRDLSGFVYSTYKPQAILRNATATVSVADEGVFLISPYLAIDPTTLTWAYQFANATSTPDGCTYFNGSSTRMTIPSATAELDSNAFSVYAEWTPNDSEHDAQLLVGHYYWELLQNKNDVEFYISTYDGEDGVRAIRAPFDNSKFFGRKHTALAIYSPAKENQPSGYIDLYVDNRFSGRTYFGAETVQKEGLAERDITLGKSGHSDASFFQGCINDMRIMKSDINTTSKEVSFNVTRDDAQYSIPLVNNTASTSILKNITLHVVQK